MVKLLGQFAFLISKKTNIAEDLQINSARIVDVIVDIEDEFHIEIEDDEMDSLLTVGDTINLILKKVAT